MGEVEPGAFRKRWTLGIVRLLLGRPVRVIVRALAHGSALPRSRFDLGHLWLADRRMDGDPQVARALLQLALQRHPGSERQGGTPSAVPRSDGADVARRSSLVRVERQEGDNGVTAIRRHLLQCESVVHGSES